MLTSLGLLFVCGLALGGVFSRLRLPPLVGMLLGGAVLGPWGLNLLDAGLLEAAPELRRMALVIILLRAGLALNPGELRQVGRPAALLCFVPACCEIAGMVLFAPRLLGVSSAEAALLGAVVAAVSPAVIVPRMLRLMEEGRGTDKAIPQMIMAGASVDDVFVIVLFTSFMEFVQRGEPAVGAGPVPGDFWRIPAAIGLGAAAGFGAGWLLCALLRRLRLRDTAKVLLMLSAAFALVGLEQGMEGHIPFSGTLGVMTMGVAVLRFYPVLAARMSGRFSRLWVAAEILLFTLVGAAVDVRYAAQAGGRAAALLALVLLFRMLGVWLCTLGTPLDKHERAFCMVAYLPKATVQAAIGGIPLAKGMDSGALVLTVAVLSILLTAPLGALGIDIAGGRWLRRTKRTERTAERAVSGPALQIDQPGQQELL